jgi:serine/threonine protein phosphatase PrpC
MPTSSNENLEIFCHGVEGHKTNIVDWGHYRIGYFIQKNVENKSSNNEDALFLYGKKDSLVFGVADGAGGHPKGMEAAHIAGNEIIQFSRKNDIDEFRLIKTVEIINEKIMDLKVGAHSTFSMGLIQGDTFRTSSVGDSEVLYWNSQGSLIYSNIPHSPVGHSIEAGHLEQEESLDDPDRYVVNHLLGDPVLRLEVATKMTLKKGHTILVGSDGLFDNISHESLCELMAKGSFEKSFESVVEQCLKRGDNWKKDDDISFIAIRRIKSE